MVFYRKYRPQKISELDSEEIRQKLYSAFSDLSNIPHAFLFTGPKGLGKTSAARIVAKVVNCEEKSKIKNQKSKVQVKSQNLKTKETENSIEPCNECQQCISITNGTNLDILEIDGASNRGIDEIRDLREKIKLSPSSATKKVYIIDEVHMLTTEAFNALLKTLEEPPSHVIFILCTTEPHKVPATISDRCFHMQFKLATADELLSSFNRISKEEKLDISDEALKYIAGMSDGSFRDGVKILDELASISASSKTKITKELLEEKYQISNIKYQISKLLTDLEKKNTKGALKLISELVETGVDMKFFIEKLVGELHSMLLRKVGVEESLLPGGRPKRSGGHDSWDGGTIEDLKTLIELFSKASGELKYAVLPSLPLELAVIEWGISEDGEQKTEDRFQKDGNDAIRPVSSVYHPQKSGYDKGDIWSKLIENIKVKNQSIAGILRGCSLKSHDEKEFIIETAYKFHKEKLSENKAIEVLSGAIKEISGKSAKIVVVLKER